MPHLHAATEDEVSPCIAHGCPKQVFCAANNAACSAFARYVSTGRCMTPTEPTRAIYDNITDDYTHKAESRCLKKKHRRSYKTQNPSKEEIFLARGSLSLNEAADRFKVSRTILWQWEAGRRPMSGSTFVVYKNALKVTT